jgi:hypothetical protein
MQKRPSSAELHIDSRETGLHNCSRLPTTVEENGGAFPELIGGNVVFRSVENIIYTALLFKDGDSVIVDSYGRIIDDIAPEEEIVAGKIALTNERSFYSKSGDIFSFIILALYAALIDYTLI